MRGVAGEPQVRSPDGRSGNEDIRPRRRRVARAWCGLGVDRRLRARTCRLPGASILTQVRYYGAELPVVGHPAGASTGGRKVQE